MTKIFLAIIAVLGIALSITGLLLKHELTKVGSLQTKYDTSQQYVKQLNKTLTNKDKVAKATDKIVDDVDNQNLNVETKISNIKRTVESTSKKEAKGEITPAAASSVYLDSMWRAYCTAGITNPRCASK